MPYAVIYALIGYLSGSVLYAEVFCGIFGRKNAIEQSRDANPGTANAFLYGGFWCGICTLIFDMAKGYEQEPEGGKRCYRCYKLRLDQAAKLAQEGGYDYFTTTLTISPLKNAAWLNELGQKAGELAGVRFLPSDFKKKGGYQRSIQLSKEYNLYRQNFCGCFFSKRESEERMHKEKNI